MQIKNTAIFLLLFSSVITGVTPLFAENAPSVKLPVIQGTPQGFEALDAPRETAIDVYFGGVKLGSFRAVYTSKSIAFAAPDEIVTKIPALKHDMIYHVQSAITGDLPTEIDKGCGHIVQKGCGILTPEVAGVIFYEDNFHADLFVNSSMLEEQDSHKDKILPPAPDIFSSVHALNGNFSSTSGSSSMSTPSTQQNYSLQDSSTFAYGAGRVNVVGAATNVNTQITTMSAGLDKWGLDNKLGFFDSHAMQLLPQSQLSGVSVGTSLNTNLALRDAAGSRLSLFLPQRAWVSLVYNNVIYSTDFYEAGNQILNTDSLPEGAYEVTVRIRDTNGGQTEEKRFFAKNFEIPPADQPIYFGQIGTVRNTTTQTSTLPTIGNGMITTGGTVQRLTDNIGLDADFLTIEDNLYTEAGAFILLPPDHQFRTSVLMSSNQDYGFGASYLGYAYDKRLTLSSDIRAIFAGSPPTVVTDPNAPSLPVNGSTRQASAGFGYQLDNRASLGFQGSYSKATASLKYAYGPTLRYDLLRDSNSLLTLTASSNETQSGPVHTIMLNFTMRLGAWGYSGSANVQAGSKAAVGAINPLESGDARITWNDDKDPGRLTLVGLQTRRDNSTENYIADFEHRGGYGNFKLTGAQNNTTQSTNNFYSGNFGIGIAQSGSDISVGGNQQQTSGFIVKTTGNSADVPMQVLVNNSTKDEFKTGDSVAVFVSPYQTYNVAIKPKESTAIDFDGTVKSITLYPGNILPMIWDINRVNVVLGHVMLPDGKPLVNARLEESRNLSVTDEEGMFQGELLELHKLTFMREAEELTSKVGGNNQGADNFDIFSILPSIHPHHAKPSNMTPEAQKKALMDLYGGDERDVLPAERHMDEVQEPSVPTSSAVQAQTPIPPEPPKKPLPALRCEVTLPETQETNGVYIYSEPLTCNPIPFAPEQKEGKNVAAKSADPNEDHKGAFSPALSTEAEFANESNNLLPAAPDAVESKKAEPVVLGEAPEQLADETKNTVPTVPGAVAEPKTPAVGAATSYVITVQLGAYHTQEKAEAVRDMLVAKYSELADKAPYIIKADLGEKGIWYRLRAGTFATMQDANAFCGNLLATGQTGLSCVAVRQDEEKSSENISTENEKVVKHALVNRIYDAIVNSEITVPAEIKPLLAYKASPPASPIEEEEPEIAATSEIFMVQLGAYRTEEKAENVRDMLTHQYSELTDKTPIILKADLGEKGIWYRLRVGGFSTLQDAHAFCDTLSAKGQDCNVPIEETKTAGLN